MNIKKLIPFISLIPSLCFSYDSPSYKVDYSTNLTITQIKNDRHNYVFPTVKIEEYIDEINPQFDDEGYSLKSEKFLEDLFGTWEFSYTIADTLHDNKFILDKIIIDELLNRVVVGLLHIDLAESGVPVACTDNQKIILPLGADFLCLSINDDINTMFSFQLSESTITEGFVGISDTLEEALTMIANKEIPMIEPGTGSPNTDTSSETVFVIEFYNTNLDHYFITANQDEADGIDQGAAGPGWQRTGKTFKAWLTQASESAEVCRFYGAEPNSHFYTLAGPECEATKVSPGWAWESDNKFFVKVPGAQQQCSSDSTAVHRLYNNRFSSNDSNHRYTIDLGVIPEMEQKAWIHEGVAFCAPN